MARGHRGELADRTASSRIQLELHPKNREELEWLLANTDAATYSEIFRRALHLLAAAKRAKGEGKEFGVYDPEAQHFVEVVVL